MLGEAVEPGQLLTPEPHVVIVAVLVVSTVTAGTTTGSSVVEDASPVK